METGGAAKQGVCQNQDQAHDIDYANAKAEKGVVMRKKAIISLIAILTLLTSLQLVINKPYKAYDDQPAGWANQVAANDLAGALASFQQATSPMALSANDYARVTAYASKAFMLTRYQDDMGREQAAASFFLVVKDLIPDPAFHEGLPKLDASSQARLNASEVIRFAGQDGYDKWPLEPMRFSSPLDLGVDTKLYSWAPVAENGPEMERGWGNLTPGLDHQCAVLPPRISNYDELLTAAGGTRKAREALDAHPQADRITSLAFEYVGSSSMRFEPVRIMLQILSNAAVDSDLSEQDRDTLLATAAVAFHDTMIASWKAKFTYLLANPLAINNDQLPLVIAGSPSYPSEILAITSATTSLLDHFAPGNRPRIEMPGSLISVPTTRVHKSTGDLLDEVTSTTKMLGLIYDFDVDPSKDLGNCIASYAVAASTKATR